MSTRQHGRLSGWPTTDTADAILKFWFEEATPQQWFRRDDDFDRSIQERFGALYRVACEGRLDAWRAHPRHVLSLIILLDQFSRNLFRDDARTFAQDDKALMIAREAVRRRFDMVAQPQHQAFFYMPLMHAENLSDQEECVRLFKARLPGTMNVPFAIEHRDIIARFGRFPHRNKLLGRVSTQAEVAFLKAGGFNP